MDILGGISAATEGLKLVNELRKIDKEVDKAELKLRLVEVADKLLDSKQALQQAQETEFELRRQITSLEKSIMQRATLRDRDGLLFEINAAENEVGEPFCNHRFVKEDKLFRLQYGPYHAGSHKCSNCKEIYGQSDKRFSTESTIDYDPFNTRPF